MKYVTTYTFKPFMTKEETKALLERFAEFGNAPGATVHYVRADGTGGIVIGESDDVTGMYQNVLHYGEFVDFESYVVLPVEETVPLVAEFVA